MDGYKTKFKKNQKHGFVFSLGTVIKNLEMKTIQPIMLIGVKNNKPRRIMVPTVFYFGNDLEEVRKEVLESVNGLFDCIKKGDAPPFSQNGFCQTGFCHALNKKKRCKKA